MKDQSRIKSVIVLGMGRSGTSVVAGILKILGVDMGKKLIPKNPCNPLGHFENRKFVQLNRKILAKAGGSWKEPPEEEKILALKEKFSKRIRNLIQEEQSEIWGWKDPRNSLTIELYLPFLKNPYFLVCYRNPMSVIKSLQKSYEMSISTEEAINLVRIYNHRIDKFFQKHPELRRLNIFYEELIKNPKEYLERIITFLEIYPTEEKYGQALRFILPKEKIQQLSKKMKDEMQKHRVKYLIKTGVLHPWKIFESVFKKI